MDNIDYLLINRIGIFLNFLAGFLLAPELLGTKRIQNAEKFLETNLKKLQQKLYTFRSGARTGWQRERDLSLSLIIMSIWVVFMIVLADWIKENIPRDLFFTHGGGIVRGGLIISLALGFFLIIGEIGHRLNISGLDFKSLRQRKRNKYVNNSIQLESEQDEESSFGTVSQTPMLDRLPFYKRILIRYFKRVFDFQWPRGLGCIGIFLSIGLLEAVFLLQIPYGLFILITIGILSLSHSIVSRIIRLLFGRERLRSMLVALGIIFFIVGNILQFIAAN